MRCCQCVCWLVLGLTLGLLGGTYFTSQPRVALAYNDRTEDCIMCTGSVILDAQQPIFNQANGGKQGKGAQQGNGAQLGNGALPFSTGTVDGIWLLDYKAGKLLATLVDRSFGKILPWAEVDLTQEFNLAAKQNVHFMMTTGLQANGQSVLYVAETVTGRIAVYSMSPQPDPRLGVYIRRHDATKFRQ